MKVIKTVNVVVLLCVLFSCATSNPTDNPVKTAQETAAILSKAPNAVESVLDCLKKADIVFIGATGHRLSNEPLFIRENLQRFYDAGVRYLLFEGGGGRLDDSPLASEEELLDKQILLYYPWEYTGGGYKAQDWEDSGAFSLINYEIYRINMDKNDSNTLKLIGLEFGRQNVISGTMDPWELLNYRDEYMANMAFNYIDNAAPGEKFLVGGGGEHGIIERIGPYSNPDVWKPLGAYLKEKYKERFISLNYITLDEGIKMNESYQDIFQSAEWQAIPDTPKLLTRRQMEKLHELWGIQFEFVDSYIVDKSGIQGIKYSYILFNPDVLQEIIAQTKQYEAEIALLSSEGRLNYHENAELYYNIRELFMNVYYLRLFFGDYFPYDFWNPQMSLREAVTRLESVVLAEGANPRDFMRFPIPPIEAVRDYHDNIELFVSLKSVELMQEDGSGMVSDIERIFKRCDPYMQKAHELFPYELWTDYWYANMYAALHDYEKAYPYIQTLLGNPVVYSMQIYPDVLELASRVAESLGKREESAEYQSLLDGLTNEFGIDISAFSLFLVSDDFNG